MKVLSLYDGMSCGMIAFRELGIPIEEYHAYEIDKFAVQTSKHNFPEIIHHGDVFEGDFTQYKGFDWLIGGSPCTYWSIAQKNNRETEASGIGWELFSQYVRALHEAEPQYFLYENNKSMSKEIRASITETFGFDPICINSALVSAQNRQRLYWVGKRNSRGTYDKVDVEQPEDRGILLKDISETGNALPSCNNFSCMTASYNGAVPDNTIERSQRTMVAEPIGTTADGKSYCLTSGYANGSGEKIGNYAGHTLEKGCKSMAAEPIRVGSLPRPNGELSQSQGFRIYDTNGKSVTLKVQSGGAGGKTGLYAVCVAQRGRYTDSGNRHTKGTGPVEQYLEARVDNKTNAITTVQKDNNVAEPVFELCELKIRGGRT